MCNLIQTVEIGRKLLQRTPFEISKLFWCPLRWIKIVEWPPKPFAYTSSEMDCYFLSGWCEFVYALLLQKFQTIFCLCEHYVQSFLSYKDACGTSYDTSWSFISKKRSYKFILLLLCCTFASVRSGLWRPLWSVRFSRGNVWKSSYADQKPLGTNFTCKKRCSL